MIIQEGSRPKDPVDITKLYIDLMGKHRNVFIDEIGDTVFIYRALSRAEYRKTMADKRLEEADKEEVICETCVLYPEGFDFEDCLAGIPSCLHRQIIENSCLSPQAAVGLLMGYRTEMWDLDEQATCIINEAFPQFDIEEIEDWDMEKTMKYLSRAEWKLSNLRGAKIDPNAFIKAALGEKTQEEPEEKQEVKTQELQSSGKKTKEKMTPEKLAELKQKFPDINWENDEVLRTGKFTPESFDTTPVALRPGY